MKTQELLNRIESQREFYLEKSQRCAKRHMEDNLDKIQSPIEEDNDYVNYAIALSCGGYLKSIGIEHITFEVIKGLNAQAITGMKRYFALTYIYGKDGYTEELDAWIKKYFKDDIQIIDKECREQFLLKKEKIDVEIAQIELRKMSLFPEIN
ncbi:MAG: hypothetical protein ACRDDZ_01340 [Marinifilaceae bacterium]